MLPGTLAFEIWISL